MNIKFNYLYRDAGNFKKFGSHIFSNLENLSLSEIENEIRSLLIDGEFFEPLKWGVPPLRFSDWDEELDHLWNEFESLELTEEKCTSEKTINKFILDIKNNSKSRVPID